MTRAKDISKIVTDANLSGTLDVTGDLTVDTNTLHVDSANNRVGIGTSSPTGKFQVDGGRSYFSANSEAFALYLRYNTSTAGVFVGSPSTDTFTVSRSGGQEHLRIDSSGNVGIGTTSPVGKLDLGATTGVKLTLYPTNYSIGVESNELRIASNQNITFYSSGHSGTERMRIDSSGRVGIGTSSPTQKLQVSGASSQYVSVVSTDSGNTGVLFGDSGQVDQGYVLYANSDDSLRIGTSNTERMRIDSSGTVFINGTTSGVSNGGLNVETTSAGVTTTALSLHNQSGGNDSGVQISHRGKRNTGAQHDYSYIQSVADDVTAGNSSLRFWTSGSASLAERMRIDSSGNVGIGESNPVAKTHIQGSGTSGQVTASLILENSSSGTAGMDITGSAGSSRLRFLYGGGPSTGTNTLNEAINIVLEGSNAGNVGIGTTPISNQRLYVLQNTNNTACQISNSDTAGFTSDALFIYNTRTTSNSTYNHISAFNGSFTNGFIVRDSGNAENTNDSYGPIASDERLKQDIVDCGEQWNDLKNLRIRKFRYRSNPQGHLQIGCIAQEAEQVSPNLISRRVPTKHEILVNPDLGNLVDDLDRPIEDEEGNITGYEQKVETDTEVLSFKSSVLFWKATKALQEAMTRIEALETANTALEARIVALETA